MKGNCELIRFTIAEVYVFYIYYHHHHLIYRRLKYKKKKKRKKASFFFLKKSINDPSGICLSTNSAMYLPFCFVPFAPLLLNMCVFSSKFFLFDIFLCQWRNLSKEEKERFEEKAKKIAEEQAAKQEAAEKAFNDSLNNPQSPWSDYSRSMSPAAGPPGTNGQPLPGKCLFPLCHIFQQGFLSLTLQTFKKKIFMQSTAFFNKAFLLNATAVRIRKSVFYLPNHIKLLKIIFLLSVQTLLKLTLKMFLNCVCFDETNVFNYGNFLAGSVFHFIFN